MHHFIAYHTSNLSHKNANSDAAVGAINPTLHFQAFGANTNGMNTVRKLELNLQKLAEKLLSVSARVVKRWPYEIILTVLNALSNPTYIYYYF